jgi:hypothetical protein
MVVVLGYSYPARQGPKTPSAPQERFELPRRQSYALLFPCFKRR